jgi:S1-C subfamily serine protease
MRNRVLLLIVVVMLVGAASGAGMVGGAVSAALLLHRSQVTEPVAEPIAVNTRLEAANTPLTAGPSEQEAILAAVRATRPAVVTVLNIQRVRTSFFAPATLMPAGSGSGVVFDKRGYIATNAHVIQGAESVEVIFQDGRRVPATLLKGHLGYDVAILQVEGDLPAVAKLGDSSKLEAGMRVLAIGSPLGTEYQNTVTTGIIAGLGRRVKEPVFDWSTMEYREADVVNAPLIQTDAAINSGNSGGPLVNLNGEVIGLNTLIVRSDGRTTVEGLGFAIPSNIVRTLADEWIDGVRRPSLGVEFETLDPMTAREEGRDRGIGAVITQIAPGSGAEKAGLRVGDLVVAIDGVSLDLDHSLVDLLWSYRSGDTVRLTIERGTEQQQIDVRLGDTGQLASGA